MSAAPMTSELPDCPARHSLAASGGSAAGLRLLDLFCCEGGAGMGYARAGFDVTGVDIVAKPRNPHPVIVADAIEYAHEHCSGALLGVIIK